MSDVLRLHGVSVLYIFFRMHTTSFMILNGTELCMLLLKIFGRVQLLALKGVLSELVVVEKQ